MNLLLLLILTMISLVAADDKRAPSFFTAMRGKKSDEFPNNVFDSIDYDFMDNLPPEESNIKTNPLIYNLGERKGRNL